MARTVQDDSKWQRVAHPLPGQPGHGRDSRESGRIPGGAADRPHGCAVACRRCAGTRCSGGGRRRACPRGFPGSSSDADFGYVMVDGTIVRAHRHAAGTPKTCGGHPEKRVQAIGRSRGGRAPAGAATGIVSPTGAPGNPVRFAPLPAVAPLPTRVGFGALIADKACDADVLRADLAERRAQAVVPPKANRTGAVECAKEMYQWRHLVENFFCNPKRFRRIATRCGEDRRQLPRHDSRRRGLPGARMIVHTQARVFRQPADLASASASGVEH